MPRRLAESPPAYADRDIRPSTAKRCHPCPAPQMGWHLSDARPRHSELHASAHDPPPAQPHRPTHSPMGKLARRETARHTATPTHEASACPPTPHKPAHPLVKSRSPVCSPIHREMFRSTSRAENCDRQPDDSAWRLKIACTAHWSPASDR